MLNDLQKEQLAAPLDKGVVKTRKMAGSDVSFIEGWHAIAEANRIFGFDGWTRETVDMRCVSERERTIGSREKPGWGVTYTAKVRVTVGSVIREGVGAGHGIDVDLGQAHESAIKEAETDAMKRALMTFGNPFGLALYDKDRRNVAEPPTEAERIAGLIQEDPVKGLHAINEAPTGSLSARQVFELVASAMDGINTPTEMERLFDQGAGAIITRLEKAKPELAEGLDDYCQKRLAYLAQAPVKEKAA